MMRGRRPSRRLGAVARRAIYAEIDRENIDARLTVKTDVYSPVVEIRSDDRRSAAEIARAANEALRSAVA
jgi:hypothetical protein